MHVIDIGGGLMFTQSAAEEQANRLNAEHERRGGSRLRHQFVAVALAQQHTIIGWVIVDRDSLAKVAVNLGDAVAGLNAAIG